MMCRQSYHRQALFCKLVSDTEGLHELEYMLLPKEQEEGAYLLGFLNQNCK